MNSAPHIPDEIAKNITKWLRKRDKLKTSDLKQISNFYHSLDIYHNDHMKYYRGLNITKDGFDDFLKSGKLKLKKRSAESWTCNSDIAFKFTPDVYMINQMGIAGIILRKQIPENKMWFNLEKLANRYAYHRELDHPAYIMMEQIKSMKECELVSKSICTSCTIDDFDLVEFKHHVSNKNSIAFLESLNLDSRSWNTISSRMGRKGQNYSVIRVTRINSKSWDLLNAVALN